MTFPGYVLAAILHHRFALPARAIAALFGCDRSTIGHELPRIAQLLAATATTIPPGPLTLATFQDLRDYAAGNGIILPPAPQDHTPPAGHASHPDTPQTHLKKGRVPPGAKGPRTPLPGWPTHCDHHQMCDRASRRKASSEVGPVQAVTDVLRLRRAVKRCFLPGTRSTRLAGFGGGWPGDQLP
jgi:hypothetical protein